MKGEKKDALGIINCIIGAIGLISIVVAIISFRYDKKKEEMLRAPLLQVASYTVNEFGFELLYPQDSGKPDSEQFSLDRRTFLLPNTQEKLQSYSFYMNVTRSSSEDAAEIIALGTMCLRNAGYDMASFELEKVDILFLNGKTLVLSPRQVGGGPVHNILNMTEEAIDIMVSYRVAKKCDHSLFKDNIDWNRKKELVGENVLNTYLPGELSCDLWKRITLTCVTCNMHNERYRQEFDMVNTDGVITTSSRLLERVK